MDYGVDMPEIARVRTVFSGLQGTPYYSNLYFEATVGGAQDHLDNVAAFWTTLSAGMNTALTWTIDGSVARIDDADGSLVGVDSGVGATGSGSTSGEMLPFASQGLLRLLTGVVVGTRALRGKVFVPGAMEALSPSGVPSGDYQTLLETAGGDLESDSSATGQWVVWSKTHGSSSPVITVQAWDQWAVLRSRRD